ncbi:hypothetical protein AVEN_243665-1 [Araneus ventricosus]|uniref:PiggyBac transposable element-derived protein domain-containing protein n=1 Tax=Araneus ventricosus TaxID=182803 RepID=A0A4Y2A511_ARAVE|nr:hypothetical protein AVEN_243665-1 [Araneus ventricosus]
MLWEKEILQMFYNLFETDSSDEKSDLSQDAYIPDNESEPTSPDECFTEIAQNDFSSEFENEEDSSITSIHNTQEVLEQYSSKILKHDNITLTEYQGKENKSDLLLSTLHPTLEVECNEKKTPEVNKFYNSTKHGVDVLDQMAKKYLTKSASRRWLVQVFFNILDLTAQCLGNLQGSCWYKNQAL